MADPQYTIDDMLRLGAENSRLKARVAELEERLTDEQIEKFSYKLFEAWAVMYHDQQTRGPLGQIIQQLRGEVSQFSVPSLLRAYRRFG